MGNLHKPRKNHRVIYDGISFLIVGGNPVKWPVEWIQTGETGYYKVDCNIFSSERCVFDNTSESMSCKDKYGVKGLVGIEDNYPNPALFLIDQTYYE